MNFKVLTFFISLLLFSSCASKKNAARYQDQPPRFFGKLIENTTARYNAFYNANTIYKESLIASKDSYQENYIEPMPVSVQDAVSKSGAMSGEMDNIIKKTARVIDKKPYSKWVDDNYLLNGIAHYVKGDYEMALDIFTYVSSEYKNGVEFERVGARQKVKRVNLDKLRKEQAKEKMKEYEKEQKRIEQEQKDKIKKRKEKGKKESEKKEKKYLTKKEQFELKQQAKKEGRDVTTKELLKEIREQQRVLDEQKVKITEKDVEAIKQAPVLKNDNANNPGILGHPLAAKDAMLWLAKTYITSEKFIAANAVLTAINEDESFPNRLNKEYYLTYADLHIRLDNLSKAAEYVQLAIEAAPNKDKGRLYYVLGQIYSQNNQPQLAEEAFATVEKYHPYYDMVYHANMQIIRDDYKNGEFASHDYVSDLKKMTRDAKNEDFLGEVHYYLANAYAVNQQTEEAVENYEKALEYKATQPFQHANAYLSLADYYYSINDYKNAQPNYKSAVEDFTDENQQKQLAQLKAEALQTINASYTDIALQDSLLQLAQLPNDKLVAFLTNKIDEDLKEQRKQKMQEANEEFGTKNRNNNSSIFGRRDKTNSESFYFNDMQQTIAGYSTFKQQWGDRANVDGWRRSAYSNRLSAIKNRSAKRNNDISNDSPDELLATYLKQIPATEKQKVAAKQTIANNYLNIATVFIKQLGEFSKGEEVLKELIEDRTPSQEVQEQAQQLLILAYEMNGDKSYKNKLQQTNVGKEAVNEALNAETELNSEIEQLYTAAYQNYESKNYELVLKAVNDSKSYQNNQYKDKFAFLEAMSKGQLQGKNVLIMELKSFIDKNPNSPLKEKAQIIINN